MHPPKISAPTRTMNASAANSDRPTMRRIFFQGVGGFGRSALGDADAGGLLESGSGGGRTGATDGCGCGCSFSFISSRGHFHAGYPVMQPAKLMAPKRAVKSRPKPRVRPTICAVV